MTERRGLLCIAIDHGDNMNVTKYCKTTVSILSNSLRFFILKFKYISFKYISLYNAIVL